MTEVRSASIQLSPVAFARLPDDVSRPSLTSYPQYKQLTASENEDSMFTAGAFLPVFEVRASSSTIHQADRKSVV